MIRGDGSFQRGEHINLALAADFENCSAAVADKLSGALRAALGDPGVRAKIEQLGALAPGDDRAGPQYAARFIEAEIQRWTDLVREVNIPPP